MISILKFVIVLLIGILPNISYSQLENKVRIITIGSEFSGNYISEKDWTNGKKNYFFVYKAAPFICYYPSKNFGIGVIGEYDFMTTTFNYYRDDLWGYGFLVRQYLPHEFLKIEFIDQYLRFFFEMYYLRTNYYPKKTRDENDILPEYVRKNLDVNVLKLHLGTTLAILKPFKFKYFRNLNLEVSYRPEWYLGHNFQHTYRMGIEYNFYKSKKEQ